MNQLLPIGQVPAGEDPQRKRGDGVDGGAHDDPRQQGVAQRPYDSGHHRCGDKGPHQHRGQAQRHDPAMSE